MKTLDLPKVIGHRGACHYAPENTLASLYKAHELGVKWVEFDVALTQDGQAIIMHDVTLNRTTNGRGLVAETTYAQIATLDAGSWFAAEFIGEKVPTFIEYLTCAAALGLGINVEIKPTVGMDKPTAQAVIDILATHWPDTQPPPLVSSFSVESITHARALNKNIHLALVMQRWLPGWQEILTALNCTSLHLKHTLVTAEKVQEAKSYVPYVLAYTVDSVRRARKLYEMGVDALFSNVPDRLAQEDSSSSPPFEKGGDCSSHLITE